MTPQPHPFGGPLGGRIWSGPFVGVDLIFGHSRQALFSLSLLHHYKFNEASTWRTWPAPSVLLPSLSSREGLFYFYFWFSRLAVTHWTMPSCPQQFCHGPNGVTPAWPCHDIYPGNAVMFAVLGREVLHAAKGHMMELLGLPACDLGKEAWKCLLNQH